MLSTRSNFNLKKEIKFLRRELHQLELGIHYGLNPVYPRAYNPVLEDMIEWKKYLYSWKKTRLEALETFTYAQLVITEMEYSNQFINTQITFRNPRYQRKTKKPRNKTIRAICASDDPNKENQRPPSKQAQIQTRTDMAVDNIKTENDSKENIAQSIADTTKKLKKEKVDYDYDKHDVSVMNSNINANFVPELLPAADVKVENFDSTMESNGSRKRKSRSQRRRSKRAKTQ